MLANYTIGVPNYPVHGVPMQPTSVPIMTQQLSAHQPPQSAPSNTSGLLEFSQLLADTKVGMSKIDLKIDEVLKKVDSIKSESSTAVVTHQKPDIPAMLDPNLVLHSITKVVEESRTLKQELLDRDTRIESLNQKNRQLLESNQRYVEQSQHMMEKRSDSLHSQSSANNSHIIKLQEENSLLKSKMDEANRKLDSRKFEIGEQESEVSDMQKRNELLSQKMNMARTKFREKESEIDDLKNEIEKLQRDAGKQKATRQSAKKEATDLNDLIEELNEKIRSEKQSKKKIQNKITRIEEDLIEVKEERDRLAITIEERRKKQLTEKNKHLREIEDVKRGYEDEINVLKTQMQEPTGPTQADLAKVEATWKRKMQEGIAKSVSELEEKCGKLTGSEDMLKSQVQRLEKKVSAISHENSHLQQENTRVLEELDEFESVKNRNITSQGLVEKQTLIIEQSYVRENDLQLNVDQLKEDERNLIKQVAYLEGKIHELENREEPEQSDEWKDKVKHVMNQFYASVQASILPDTTLSGRAVHEILREAIKEETTRVLSPGAYSSGSDAGDSTDEDRNRCSPLRAQLPTDGYHEFSSTQVLSPHDPNYSLSPVPQQSADANLSLSPVPQQSADTDLSLSPVPQQSADANLSLSPVPQQSADTDPSSSHTRQELTLSLSPVPQQSADPNLSLSPVPQQSADPNLSLSPVPQQSADTDPSSSHTRQELTLSLSPVPQQSADPNLSLSPVPQQSADPNLSLSPVPQQSADPNLSLSPVPQQSADPNLSLSPVPQQSADPNLSLSPVPQQSADPNLSLSPVPQQSADPNLSLSPVPQQSADTDPSSSHTRQELTLSLSPVPQQSADPNLNLSPVPQQSADPNLSLSPVPQQSADPNLSLSPVPQQSADPNLSLSPVPQQSADPNLSLSPVPQQSAVPLQSPLRQSIQPSGNSSTVSQQRYISLDEEDRVEDKHDDVRSSLSSSTDIHDTVIPLTSTLQAVATDQSEDVSSEKFSSPLDQSPSSSPLPNQYLDSSPRLDHSPSTSPIPNQHPSSSPPLHQPTTSPIPNQCPKSTSPDISDNIQEYTPTSETAPPSHESPPPDDPPYVKHLPSHPSSPPPMDLQSSLRDSLTTGNFSPDLIDKHFASPLSEDKISSLDAILGSSFPSLDGPSKPRVQKTTVDTMDTPKDTTVSNPLLDGSSDSESDIFGTTKKPSPPSLDDEKPAKPTGKTLFEDSGDDDLDWLN